MYYRARVAQIENYRYKSLKAVISRAPTASHNKAFLCWEKSSQRSRCITPFHFVTTQRPKTSVTRLHVLAARRSCAEAVAPRRDGRRKCTIKQTMRPP